MTCTGTTADADHKGLAARNWPTGKRPTPRRHSHCPPRPRREDSQRINMLI